MAGPSTSPGGEFFFPLSGAVTQWFDWIRNQGAQLGFINVYNASSAHPEAEQRIIEDVASYGRQLGRVIDALRILVDDRVGGVPAELTPQQKLAMQRLEVLAADIDEAKQRLRGAGG
jgi:hypothetical protein